MLCIGNQVYMLEETTVDRSNNVMVLKSKNLSWAQILQMEETCNYTVHKENPEWFVMYKVLPLTQLGLTMHIPQTLRLFLMGLLQLLSLFVYNPSELMRLRFGSLYIIINNRLGT